MNTFYRKYNKFSKIQLIILKIITMKITVWFTVYLNVKKYYIALQIIQEGKSKEANKKTMLVSTDKIFSLQF